MTTTVGIDFIMVFCLQLTVGGPSVNQNQISQLGMQQQIIITTRGAAGSSATLPQASPSGGQPIVVQLPDQGDTLSNVVALNPTQRSSGEQVTLTIAHAARTVNPNVPQTVQNHPSQTQVLSAVSTNMPSTGAQSSTGQTTSVESTADQSSAGKFAAIEELCDNLQRLAHSKSMYAGSIPGGQTREVSLNTGQKQADSAQSVVATPTDAATPSMYVQLPAGNMSEPDCQITGTTESDCQITGTTEADCQITGTTDPNCEITGTTEPTVETTGSTTICDTVVELETSDVEQPDSNNQQAIPSNNEMDNSASHTQQAITGAITDKCHDATTSSREADDDMQFPSTIEVTLTSNSPETGEKQTSIIVDGQTLTTRKEVLVNEAEKTSTMYESDNSDEESGRLVIADTYSESVVTETDTGATKEPSLVTDNEQDSSSINESLVPDKDQRASKEQHVVNSSITTLGKLVLSDSVAESLLTDNVEQATISVKDQSLRNSHRSESMSESIVTESDQGYVSAKDQSFDHPLIAPSSPGHNPTDISTEDGVLSAMDVTHDESMEGPDESSNKDTVHEEQSDNMDEASASVDGRIRDPPDNTMLGSQLDSLNRADSATHEQSDPSNTVHSCPTAQSDSIDTPDTHTEEHVSIATSEHNNMGEESSIPATASPDTRSRDVILKTLLDDSIDRAFQRSEDGTTDTQGDNRGYTQQQG